MGQNKLSPDRVMTKDGLSAQYTDHRAWSQKPYTDPIILNVEICGTTKHPTNGNGPWINMRFHEVNTNALGKPSRSIMHTFQKEELVTLRDYINKLLENGV